MFARNPCAEEVHSGPSRMLRGQEDASMYNAWVGPLELGACEYRFQAPVRV